MGRERASGWLSRGLLLVAVALVATGLVSWWQQPGSSSSGTGPGGAAGSAPSSAAATAEQEAGGPPAARELPTRPGDPVSVRLPALGVEAPVDAVGLRGDVLVPPSDPSRVGWWGGGAEPGAARGSALLAGHTVHTGGGALDDLERLRPGDRVVVEGRRAEATYVVGSVRTFAKGRLAREAERLFRQDGPHRLVLLTCEDWDGSAYRSNVVVTARPA